MLSAFPAQNEAGLEEQLRRKEELSAGAPGGMAEVLKNEHVQGAGSVCSPFRLDCFSVGCWW